MQLEQVSAWLSSKQGIKAEVQWLQHRAGVSDFLVGQSKRLRLSDAPLSDVTKLLPLTEIPWVPRLWDHGIAVIGSQQQHYALLDYVPGETLYSAYNGMSAAQRQDLVKDLSTFMSALHSLRNDAYDIGHYIPIIPRHRDSWAQGHYLYLQHLRDQVTQMQLHPKAHQVVEKAFRYIAEHITSLQRAVGPRLLHNDLHPKNIILCEGRLAGVIDWECAQYGEPDFELAHLVHWSLCPEAGAPTFNDLAEPLLASKADEFTSDILRARLTIYQLEHELNQLAWCWAAEGRKVLEGQEAAQALWSKVLAQRLERLSIWLEGHMYQLLP